MQRSRRMLMTLVALSIWLVAESASSGCVEFHVVTALDSIAVPGASIVIAPGNYGGATNVSGRVVLCASGADSISFSVSSSGYVPEYGTVELTGRHDTIQIQIFLFPDVEVGDSVTIFGERLHRKDEWIGQLTGRYVEVHRDASIAETLDALPGFSVQSAGPNTGQVVSRGFSGDRVTITQDGVTSPDASTTAADHAVTISPALARKISILYGPEAFLHSSTPVGGVIDVETSYDRNSQAISGFSTLRYGSGGSVVDLAGVVNWQPVTTSKFGLHSVYRRNGDINLSDGSDLPGSDGNLIQFGGSASLGVDGHIGSGSYDYFASEYGIPPDPSGPHAGGVRIDMRKHSGQASLALQIDSSEKTTAIEFQVITSDYIHREVEADGIVGVEYGIAQTSGLVTARRTSNSSAENRSVVRSGFTYSHVAANGLRLRPTSRHWLHATAFHSAGVGPFVLNGSLRYDWIRSSEQKANEPVIRNHQGLSGGVGAIAEMTRHLSAGISLISTFRGPDVRELFSRGPHAANRAYEIGNPDLRSEKGYGFDLFCHLSSSDIDAEIRFFGTSFSRFLMPEATGDTNRVTSLPIYRSADNGARMFGAEIDVEIPIASDLNAHVSGDYVVGEITDSGSPLPRIPPATLRVALEWESEQFLASVSTTARAGQNRTGPFESATSGSVQFGCNLQYRTFVGITIHTVTLTAENLTKSLWYDHLSRYREIYPAAGRAVSIGYRVDF